MGLCSPVHRAQLHGQFQKMATTFAKGGALDDMNEMAEGGDGPTLHDVRVALLQDVYEHLPKHGFEVQVFTSVDDDELFVCASLRSEQAVRHLLSTNQIRLQIQQSVVSELGIGQDPKQWESSPAYITYNKHLSRNVLGEYKTDYDFFRVYGEHSGMRTILAGQMRINLIYKYLNTFINLDYAQEAGFISQWYPAHVPGRIAELRGNWANWFLLRDLSVVQPVDALKDYFGARVAFIFAWNGLYCRLLLALVPAVLCFKLANYLARTFAGSGIWDRGSVTGLSLCVAIWSKFAVNLWYRQQGYLILNWDLHDSHKDMAVRADFAGELRESTVDSRLEELHYPPWKYKMRMFISWIITLMFCGFVLLCVLIWIDRFNGKPSMVASIVQAIMIQIFTLIYNWMAEALTVGENHKYQELFYDSYLVKQFIFQFINQYSAMLFIATKQQFTETGCMQNAYGRPDCVLMINKQLPTTLLVLAVMRVVQVVIATLIVKIKLWWESRTIVMMGKDAPVYSYVEEQSKYKPFRIREQIEVMTQLSLTLGYVLIFGALAPLIIPLCCIVFFVQLRAGAVLLTAAANRTVPRLSNGIGPWQDVIQFLLVFGVVFSGYLLVQYAPMFQGAEVLTKLFCMCLFCTLVAAFWKLIDLFIPQQSPGSRVLEARRDYVKQKILQKAEDAAVEKRPLREVIEEPEELPSSPGSPLACRRRDRSGRSPIVSSASMQAMMSPENEDSFSLLSSRHSQKVQTGDWANIPKAIPET